MERKLINFCYKTLGHSHEIVDALYGFYQSQDLSNQSWIDIKCSRSFDSSAALNIYLDYMPEHDIDLSEYDAVIYSNGCEPLIVSTQIMHDSLVSGDAYLACNSYLSPDHPLADRVIWFPANILVLRDLWCRHFTSAFYQAHTFKADIKRDRDLLLINGRLDSWRHHLSIKIQQSCPRIPQKSSVSKSIHETNDSFFESSEDSKFRDTVNDLYAQEIIRNQPSLIKYVSCGIDDKFGRWPQGYFLMPEYFSYRCVIFPESTWQNDEVAITEKILKCAFAGCFPWPVGGSNINRMYNEIGFYTAWNLLPEQLKAFDSEKDHMARYDLMVNAMAWLSENTHVMVDQSAQNMLQSNLVNFLSGSPEVIGVKKFDKIIRRLLENK